MSFEVLRALTIGRLSRLIGKFGLLGDDVRNLITSANQFGSPASLQSTQRMRHRPDKLRELACRRGKETESRPRKYR